MEFQKSKHVSKLCPSMIKRHHFLKKLKLSGYYYPSKLSVLYDDEEADFCSGETFVYTRDRPQGVRVVIPYDLFKKIPLPGESGTHTVYAVHVSGHAAEKITRYGCLLPFTGDVIVAKKFNTISLTIPANIPLQNNEEVHAIEDKKVKGDGEQEEDTDEEEEYEEQEQEEEESKPILKEGRCVVL